MCDRYELELRKGIVKCDTYLEVKQAKSRSNGTLFMCAENHTLHSDVAGPIPPQTHGMAKYMLTFVREKPRFTEIFTIRQRSEVRNILVE